MLQFLRRASLSFAGAALPFDHFNVNLVALVVTPSKVAVAILLFVVGAQWLMERRPLPRDAARPWILLLAASVIVSTVISLAKGTAPIELLKMDTTWFSLFLFYLALSSTLRTRRDVDLLIVSAGVGTVVVVITALAGFGWQAEAQEGQRAGGIGGNVNQVAHIIGLLLPLTLSVFLSQRALLRKLLLAGIMAVQMVGIFLTLSRSGILAIGAMGALWFVRTGSVGLLRYGVPTLVVAALALALAPASFYERLETMNPFTSSPRGIEDSALADALSSRMEYQVPDALGMFASNPLTGVGVLRTVPWSYEHGTKYHNIIHNDFLQLAAENGLLGLIPFVALHVLLWRNMTRVRRAAERPEWRRDQELRHLRLRAIFMQIALVGTVVNGMAHATLRDKVLWMVFAVSPILVTLARQRIAELHPHEEVATASPMPTSVGFEAGYARASRSAPTTSS